MDSLNRDLIDRTAEVVAQFQVKLENVLREKRQLKNDSETLNSLTLEKDYQGNFVGLTATDYFYYVVHGRGAGKMPPPDKNGNWLPYPVAKMLAEKGNKEKMKPTADAYDVIFDEMVEAIEKEAGKVALAYIKKTNQIFGYGK